MWVSTGAIILLPDGLLNSPPFFSFVCNKRRETTGKFTVKFWCRIHLWFRYVGGFVRKVDDFTAYLAAQPSRLRAHHRNITTTRWRLCVTILHLQQYSRRLNLLLFFCTIFLNTVCIPYMPTLVHVKPIECHYPNNTDWPVYTTQFVVM